MKIETEIPISLPDIDVDKITSLDDAKQIIKQLLNTLELVLKRLDVVEKENALLKQEIARLKKQPKQPLFTTRQNSSYSASKHFKEKGKQWHKSVKKGNIPIDQEVIIPEIERCACGSTDFETINTMIKVAQGLLIQRNNTAYHGRRKKCVRCGRIYKPQIPEDVKGLSFDSNLQSLVSLFKFYGRYTHPLLHGFLTMFGVQISNGEITEILQRNSRKLHPAYSHLRTIGIKQSSYIQSDATCSKRKQLATQEIVSQHLHVIGNKFLSLFKITKSYNAEVMNGLLGKHGRRKLYVSDDASPNGRKLKVKKKQLCWIHEDRHYLKLCPRLKIHKEKLQEVLDQLGEFYHVAKLYGRDPTPEAKKSLRKLFDIITKQKTGYEALDHQLLLTKQKRDRLLLFLNYPFLPIHNNQCELDLREFVIIRKISGETKSLAGDRSIERHLSIIQTAKKQGLDVFQTLHGLLTGQLSPIVLTAKSV
jgi:hypothetical protein